MRNPEHTKEKLLKATAALVAEGGAATLTLERVARAAKVSKGGLLHHFPTKEALVRGLLDELRRVFEARLARELTAEPEGGPGRWTRAYVRASFRPDPEECELTDALAGALAAHSELIETVREAFAFLDERSREDGLPPARAAAVRLACDGLWLGELAGLPVVSGRLRDELFDELLTLARP